MTGSRNLLGELKWARAAGRVANAPLSDVDLVASVTRVAADILGWGRLLGSIVAGKRADLVVVRGVDSDPYAALVGASEADVQLVIVNGVARTGIAPLMSRFGRGREDEKIAGEVHLFDFEPENPVEENAPRPSLTLADATARLRDALANLPELAAAIASSPVEPDQPDEFSEDAPQEYVQSPRGGVDRRIVGLAPMTLEPLTIADDPDYLPRMFDQRNIPREFVEALGSGPVVA